MLEIRPSCEQCHKPLPPNSTDARICSFECTFCTNCVDTLLKNVCPNCGGGFVPRPILPARNWTGGSSLITNPAGSKVKHRPVNVEVHAKLLAKLAGVPSESR